MATLGYTGSYLGLTYNGIHSSTLGLTRVSNSNRQTENLIPTLKDVTSDIVGTDGNVYFGTDYTKRVFSVSFVFDGLTLEQLKQIKMIWMDRNIHDLIFDEYPNRIYSAKITSSGIIKYLCFDEVTPQNSTNVVKTVSTETTTQEIYKGELSLSFTCFYPYARGPQPEWSYQNGQVSFNNEGDLPIPSKWWFKLPQSAEPLQTGWNLSMVLIDQMDNLVLSNVYRSTIPSPKGAGADTFIMIDMENHFIEGYDSDISLPVVERRPLRPTGRLYNQYMTGDFFLIPTGQSAIGISEEPYDLNFNYLYL